MTAPAIPDEARRIIASLGLEPHPEGGYFRETWRHAPNDGMRGHGTAIYYLLTAGDVSAWHRVDAVEIWHFYAGAPLALTIRDDTGGKGRQENFTLGPALTEGHTPQAIVPERAWQTAKSLGDWTLVGCTVSPAFDFAGFELAPPDGPPNGS